MSLSAAYQQFLQREGHGEDARQLALVNRFESLEARLISAGLARQRSGWKRWLPFVSSKHRTSVEGLSIWGGVGRGKTFLMDLFYDHLAVPRKRRIHFHRMMREIHERLKHLGETEDPLKRVAAEIANEVDVLCFDEFFVSDIGDAMILGRLLRELFTQGVTLVATSNLPPDDLYKDGLQRQQFLPAIEALKAHTEVFSLNGETDYRLRILRQAGTYFCPDDDDARRKLSSYFAKSASSEIRKAVSIVVNDRDIDVLKCAKGIAWFDFEAICGGPRSQADYIEIARWYPNVIVSGIPVFDVRLDNQARRFIALVDEFYDRRVKLILSAAKMPRQLYAGSSLQFEFERTISRLIEMQSQEYLALPHLP